MVNAGWFGTASWCDLISEERLSPFPKTLPLDSPPFWTSVFYLIRWSSFWGPPQQSIFDE
jgi:hypothetical protein